MYNTKLSSGAGSQLNTVKTVTLTKNTNPFLESFSELYKNNKQTRGSLIVALVWCLCVKGRGHRNEQFPAIVMNFFFALEATSRESFDFVSANVLVSGLWCVQDNNVKTRVSPFIICEEETVMSRLEKQMECITDDSDVVVFGRSIDGTKVPIALG